jgi:hypothetical protein
MADLEHEEWMRDREAQHDPLIKHTVVGGLQSDADSDDRDAKHTDTSREPADDDDDGDDDDEPETIDTPDENSPSA